MERRCVERASLTDVVRAAVGSRRRLDRLERLPGGSKKGVYRLTLDDGSTSILYVWDAAENYWPAPPGGDGVDRADPFSDASGADLFEAGHARLDALGVRTPRVLLVDRSRTRYPADIAVVEDVPGQSLETLLRHDPAAAAPVLERLGAALRVMHQHRSPCLGKLALVEAGGSVPGRPCERIVLDRALAHLAEAASRVERIERNRQRLAGLLGELAAAVPPREDHRLIHGELGPDHVLVDAHGCPVIIDIEGLMFFDVEWEHVFLRLRFGDHYGPLRDDGLDERRLRCYALAMHLSLVAGPLRLVGGDYPDVETMIQIAEYHTERTLSFLDRTDRKVSRPRPARVT